MSRKYIHMTVFAHLFSKVFIRYSEYWIGLFSAYHKLLLLTIIIIIQFKPGQFIYEIYSLNTLYYILLNACHGYINGNWDWKPTNTKNEIEISVTVRNRSQAGIASITTSWLVKASTISPNLNSISHCNIVFRHGFL